jgi:predicted DNA-binding transcriptional regulator AlpA
MNALLNATDIADILRVAPRVVAEKYAMQPDFPKPIRLPSLKGKGHLRWRAEEINEWIESLREHS